MFGKINKSAYIKAMKEEQNNDEFDYGHNVVIWPDDECADCDYSGDESCSKCAFRRSYKS